MDIGKIDKNLYIEARVKEPDVRFVNVRETDAVIHGLYEPYAPGQFRRMPPEAAQQVSVGVENLVLQTAGGRVRFKTDSAYVAVRVEQEGRTMSHMPILGSSGFDCYLNLDGEEVFCGSLIPPAKRSAGYESILRFPDRRLREVTLNFPLYDQVQALYLGVQEDAQILPPRPYSIEKPVVFYGSSITQGGCASRPGTSYEAILSRRMDFDYVNLGFSGSGKGEAAMAQYLAGMEMSVFVMDYDANAPDADHLRKTHGKFYDIVREAHPDLPILIAPRCTRPIWDDQIRRNAECREVIRETYDRAVAAGDKVYWVEGSELLGELGRACTVDGVHPTDLGFLYMADGIGKVLQEALKNEGLL